MVVNYVVTQADVDAGQITNTGTADSDETPPVDDPEIVPVPQSPLLAVDKVLTGNADEDGSGDVSLGDTLTYTITATNTGNQTLNNVTVSDDLTGDSTACATLAPGATCVLVVNYVVTQADVDAGQITNTGTADSDETPPVDDPEIVPVPQSPLLAVDKVLTGNADEDGSGDVSLGDTLTYTITATNTGNQTLNNVTVSDDLTGDSTACATLAPGATCVLVVNYVVTQADVDAGQITNTGTADSDETPPVDDPEIVPVPQSPLLAVDKVLTGNADEDGSGDVSLGDTLTYTITATNTGNQTLNNVTVSDDLTGDSTACATLAPGATCVLVVNYVVTQADVDAGQITNTGTADSDETPPVDDPEIVPVPQSPLLAVDKVLTGNADEDGSGDVSLGDTLTYTITATNTGNQTLNNVTVSDDLTGDSTACATLAPGATCVLVVNYVVTQADVDAGQITNTGTADSDETPPVDDPEIVPVPQSPLLAVDKVLTGNADEDGSGDVSLGDTLTYTITATNTGNQTLNNVTVSDDLTGDSTACATLAPGATCVLVVNYVVTQADVDAGQITNTGTADSDETPPVDDPEIVPVPQSPLLAVDKVLTGNADEDGSGDVSLGDTLTYTITATNTGNQTLNNVTVSDDLTGDSTACATLAPGATCVLVVNYVVTQADVDAGQITNTGTADSDETPPVDDPEIVPVPQSPLLAVDKVLTGNADEDGSGDVSLGDTLTYTITATNTGNQTLNNVTVSDDLTGDSTACATLAPGATCVLVVNYVVTQADVDAGQITNTGTADSDETPPVDDPEIVPVPQSPLLAVDKVLTGNADEDGSGDVSLGDTLTYTITATNTGNQTLNNVTVSDDLTGDSTACATLAPGATCVLVVNYVVTQADVDAGQITNTGTADSDETPPVDDPEIVPVPQSPLLAVDKVLTGNADEDGSGDVSLGDTLTYTITATNTGNQTLNNVTVSDDLTGDSTACATLAPGATCVLVVNYVVTQADVDAGQITNTGTADSDETPPVDDPEIVPVPQSPLLAVDKVLTGNADEDGSGDVSLGDTLTYTITATNTGNQTLNNVTVSDDLTGDSTACATLAPGATCVLVVNYVVTQADVDAGQITNTGTADSDETPPVDDPEIVPVPQSPLLAVDKVLTGNADEDGSGDVSLGDTLTYTITATNTGNQTLNNVTVSDDLTGDSTACATLAPGATCVLVVNYVVTQADVDAGQITNTGTADSDETPPVDDPEIVPVPQSPLLAVDKVLTGNADEDGSGDVSLGDTLTYTITATNTGNQTLNNVTVSDDLTGDSTACATLAPGATCVLVVNYVVTQADVDAGQITNTGTADSDETPPVDDPEIVPVPTPGMSIVKSNTISDPDGSGDVSVGDVVTYTYTVTNTGSATLTGVTVTDDLLGAAVLSDVGADGVGVLAPAAVETATLTYTIQASDLGTSIVNIATADSDQTGPVTDTNTIIVPTPAELTMSKTVVASVDASGVVTAVYTIEVSNSGGASGSYDVTDTITVPAGVTATLTSGPSYSGEADGTDGTQPGTFTIAGGTIVTGESLASGETESWTYTLTYDADVTAVPDGGCDTTTPDVITVDNSASIDGGVTSSDVCVEVPLEPELTMSKTVVASVDASGVVTAVYTIEVSNSGGASGSYDVTDTITVPAGVTATLTSGPSYGGEADGTDGTQPGTFTIAGGTIVTGESLASGETESWTYTLTYDADVTAVPDGGCDTTTPDVITVDNSASIDGGVTSSDVCVEVPLEPELTMSKTVVASVDASGVVTAVYTIEVSNSGGASGSYDVTDTITVPAGVTATLTSGPSYGGEADGTDGTQPGTFTIAGGTIVTGESLASGETESWTYTLTYDADVTAVPDGGCDTTTPDVITVDNSASIDGGVTSSDVCVEVPLEPELTMSKTVVASVDASGVVTAVYTIEVSNSGGASGSYDVTDTITVPAGVTATLTSGPSYGGEADGTDGTQPGTFTIAGGTIVTGESLASGETESWTYTLTYDADVTAVPDGGCDTTTPDVITVDNSASIDGGVTSSDVCVEVPLEPELTMSKTVVASVDASGVVTAVYTIEVSNSGGASGSYDVTDTITVPAGVTATLTSGPSYGGEADGTDGTQPGTFTIAGGTIVTGESLASGETESWTYTLTYDADVTAVPDGGCDTTTPDVITVDNSASIDGGVTSSDVCVEVPLEPELTMSKTVVASVDASGVVTAVYTIEVSNSGGASGSYDVTDTITVPAGVTATLTSGPSYGGEADGTDGTQPGTFTISGGTIVTGESLASGETESWTYTLTYDADVTAVPDGGCDTTTPDVITVDNSASIDGGVTSSDVCVEVPLEPELTMSKTVVASVDASGVVTAVYTIEVSNSGGASGSYDVTDTITVPAGVTATLTSGPSYGGEADGTDGTQPGTFTIAGGTIVTGESLASGETESWTYTLTYDADVTAVPDGGCDTTTPDVITVDNSASIDGGVTSSDVCVEVPLEPELTMSKTVVASVDASGVVTAVYTIEVSNSGGASGSYDVTDTITVPAGVTATLTSGPSYGGEADGTDGTQPGTFTIAGGTIVTGESLASGETESWTYTLTYDADVTAVPDGGCDTTTPDVITVDNSASIDGGVTSSDVCVEVPLEPELTMSKTVVASVDASGVVTAVYTIEVSNSGGASGSYDVTDTITVPAGVTATLTSGPSYGGEADGTDGTQPGTFTISGGTIVTGESLASGETESWTYTLTYDADVTAVPDGGCDTTTPDVITVDNSASIDGGVTSSDVCVEVPLEPELTMSKTVVASVDASGVVTAVYTIEVSNSGGASGSYDVTDTITVPAGVTATLTSGPSYGGEADGTDGTQPGTFTIAGGTIVTGESLASGETESWTYTLTYDADVTAVPDGGCDTTTPDVITVDNSASIDGGVTSSDVCVEVPLEPELTMSKTVVASVDASGVVTAVYTIEVSNSGGASGSYDVTDTITVPAGVTATLTSGPSYGGEADGTDGTQPGTFTIAGGTIVTGESLASGETESWTYTLTYDADVTAVPDGGCDTTTPDVITVDNSASIDGGVTSSDVCVEVPLEPELTMSKTVVASVDASGVVTAVYTIEVSNSGGASGSYDVTDTITVPAGVTATLTSGPSYGGEADGTDGTQPGTFTIAGGTIVTGESLASGETESWTYTLTYDADVTAVPDGGCDTTTPDVITVDNSASIDGGVTSSDVCVEVPLEPELTMSKTVVASVDASGVVTAVYTIEVSNSGGASGSYDVTDTITVPAGVTATLTSGPSYSGEADGTDGTQPGTFTIAGGTIVTGESLASGETESWTYTLTYDADVTAVPDGGCDTTTPDVITVDNSASIDGGVTSSDVCVEVPLEPELTMSKTVVASVDASGVVTAVYTIEVSNSGGASGSYDVTDTITVPAGVTATLTSGPSYGGEADGTDGTQPGTFTIAGGTIVTGESLASGETESWTYTLTYDADVTAVPDGGCDTTTPDVITVDNSASIDGGVTSSDVCVEVPLEPELTMSKTVVASVDASGVVTAVYTIEVSNSGGASGSYDVTDTITVPAGVTATLTSGPSYGGEADGTDGTQPGTFTIAGGTIVTGESLASGETESWTYTLTYDADVTAVPDGGCDTTTPDVITVDNSASIDGGVTSSDVCVEVPLEPELTMSKTVVASVDASGVVTAVYTIEVSNSGGASGSYDVTDTITVPAGVTATLTSGPSYGGEADGTDGTQPGTFTIAGGTIVTGESLASGETESWTYTLTYDADVTAVPDGGCDTTTPDVITVDNSASIDGGVTSSDVCVEVPLEPELTMSKTVVASVDASGVVTAVYTIEVSNSGGASGSYDVTDTITVPAGVTATLTSGPSYGGEADGTDGTQPGTFTIAGGTIVTGESLASGETESWTYTLTYDADVTAVPDGGCDTTTPDVITVDNSASIDGGVTSSDVCVEVPLEPELTMSKTVVASVDASGVVTAVYTIEVSNSGGASGSYDVTDTITVPAGVTATLTSGPSYSGEADGTDGTQPGTFTIAGGTIVMGESLASGETESWTYTLTYDADVTAVPDGGCDTTTPDVITVDNSASIDGGVTSSDVCVEVPLEPELTMSKTVVASVDASGVVTAVYTIEVSNSGGASGSYDVTDTITVPAGVTATLTSGPSYGGEADGTDGTQPGTFTIAGGTIVTGESLASGETESWTYTLTYDADVTAVPDGGCDTTTPDVITVDNSASIDGGVTSSDVCVEVPLEPELTMSKTVVASVDASGVVTAVYTIEVSNSGGASGSYDVTDTITVPAGVTATLTSGPSYGGEADGTDGTQPGTFTIAGGTIVTGESLASGETESWTYTLTYDADVTAVPDGGCDTTTPDVITVDNSASIDGGVTSSDVCVEVPLEPELTMSKTVVASVDASGVVTAVYTIEVSNSGGASGSYDVTDTITVPAGVTATLTSGPSYGGEADGTDGTQPGTFTIAGGTIVTGESLASGETESWTYTLTYDADVTAVPDGGCDTTTPDVITVDNSASIDGGVTSSDVCVEVPLEPELTMSKTVVASVDASGVVTAVYTIEVSNSGGASGSYDVTDTITVPAGVTATLTSGPSYGGEADGTDGTQPGTFTIAGGTIVTGESLASGETESWTYTLTYDADVTAVPDGGCDTTTPDVITVDNSASIDGGVTSSDVCVEVPLEPELTMSKTVVASVDASGVVTAVYTIEVSNSGGASGSYDVTDTITVPAGVTATLTSGPSYGGEADGTDGTQPGTFTIAGGTIVTGESLASGETESWTYTLTYDADVTAVPDGGCDTTTPDVITVDNSASIDGGVTSSDVCVEVPLEPELTMSKTVVASVDASGVVTAVYTIEVSNSGGASGSYDVTDTITVPAGVTATLTSGPSYGGEADGTDGTQPGTFTISGGTIVTGESLASGETESWTYTLTYDADVTAVPDGGCDTTTPDVITVDNSASIDGGVTSSDVCVNVPTPAEAFLGDTVWHDLNGDGIQDPTETGIEGILVNLLDTAGVIVNTVATDANGDYQFTGITPGDYVVEFVPTDGYNFSEADQGTDDTLDSDADTMTGRTQLITLLPGENNQTIDAGLYQGAVIGDRIWNDLDGDGLQDADEDPISNVRVILYDENGLEIGSLVTGEDGRYVFDGLIPGTYSVAVDPTSLPPGLVQTYDENGSLDNNSGPIVVTSGEDHDSADFGYQFNGVIGDTIWVDQNQDGNIDSGEGRIVGVPVALYEGSVLIDSTITDASGQYLFTGLASGGNYRVVVNPDSSGMGQPPAGYSAHPLGDPDVKAGVTVNPDNQTTVLLTAGGSDLNADFGYHLPSPIVLGGTIFEDINADGVLDGGDADIEGVSVSLYDNATGDFITSVFTDENGEYSFVGVSPNTEYRVVVQDPSGVLTGMNQTSMPDNNNDGGQPGDSGNENVVFITNTSNLNQDFGYHESSVNTGSGVIGGNVFFDSNQNDILDSGEGVSNTTVSLWVTADPSNPNFVPHIVATELTDENGAYIFTGLDTNDVTYEVRVDTNTLPNNGTGWTNSVDPDGNSDSQTEITLTTASPVSLDENFGYTSSDGGIISGTIWEDEDESGVLEPDETRRIEGVSVELRDADGNLVATALTDANGNYSFDNLAFGDYTVTVTDVYNKTNGYHHTDGTPGLDNNSQNDNYYSVTIDAANPTNNTADFGYRSSTTVPITLASFVAMPGSGFGQVVFTWSTETEVGNIGFRIFANIDGIWVEASDELLPAAGDSVTLESYEYVANGMDKASEFVLVDVDIYGNQVLHGPFTLGQTHGAVDKAAEARRALSADEFGAKLTLPSKARSELKSKPDADAREARKQREAEAYKRKLKQRLKRPLSSLGASIGGWILNALVSTAAADTFTVADFEVNQTGVYEVTQSTLQQSGVDIEGVDIEELSLSNGGSLVPMEILDDGDGLFNGSDAIRFIGEELDTLYTDTNVYKLALDDERRTMGTSNLPIPGGASAPYHVKTVEYAPQNLYSLTSPAGDPWYADKLLALKSGTSKIVNLNPEGIISGVIGPQLTVKLWGGSDLAGDAIADPDHHVRIFANGALVGNLQFDGVVEQQLNTTLGASSITSNLAVEVEVPLDNGYIFDLVNLESISLDYPSGFIASDNLLSFNSHWPKYRIGGFNSADIAVYAKSDDGSVTRIEGVLSSGNCSASSASCEALFAGITGEAQYYAVAPMGMLSPAIQIPIQQESINHTAEALVISHPDFIGLTDNALEQYVSNLSAQMNGAELVDVRQIYAHYAGGVFDANAIHAYIKDQYARGTRHVLLVGSDSYDYRNYLGQGAHSFIPSLYRQTDQTIHYSPVDAKYADVDDDDVPDLVIARLPVQTPAQLRDLLTKRADYLSRNYQGEAVFAADVYSQVEQYSFSDDADAAIANYFDQWNVSKAYMETLGGPGAKQVVTQQINQGTSLFVYTGHSSNDRLSFHDLFDGEDAANLTNFGQPTVVTQWGCWNIYNVEPAEISMGDRFLLEGRQGAVSVLGASTLTSVVAERILANLFYAELVQDKSIGQALLDAKREFMLTHPEHKDVLLGVGIMGFPEIVVN